LEKAVEERLPLFNRCAVVLSFIAAYFNRLTRSLGGNQEKKKMKINSTENYIGAAATSNNLAVVEGKKRK
jgi:hypothetical protein